MTNFLTEEAILYSLFKCLSSPRLRFTMLNLYNCRTGKVGLLSSYLVETSGRREKRGEITALRKPTSSAPASVAKEKLVS
jgi:hypothetical protein